MRTVQFVNLSEWWISLRTDNGSCFLLNLEPGKSRFTGLSEMNIRTRHWMSPYWRVGVLKDGKYINIKITGSDLVNCCPRFIFKTEVVDTSQGKKKMLCIEGIQHKSIDYWLRQRFIGGLMRNNEKWNKRPTTVIAREKEGPYQHPPPPRTYSRLSSSIGARDVYFVYGCTCRDPTTVPAATASSGSSDNYFTLSMIANITATCSFLFVIYIILVLSCRNFYF